jgi:hypothetical protein
MRDGKFCFRSSVHISKDTRDLVAGKIRARGLTFRLQRPKLRKQKTKIGFCWMMESLDFSFWQGKNYV